MTLDREHLELHVGEDDPLYRRGFANGYDAGWEDAPRVMAERSGAALAMALLAAAALIVGLFLGVRIASAAPRPAHLSAFPVVDDGRTGAPRAVSVKPDAEAESRPWVVRATQPSEPAAPRPLTGIASFMSRSYGPRYLALPAGPGHTVRICGKASCVTRTSTDAGPAKFLQRQGRIADLSWADFRRICGCTPELVGLTRVTVTRAISAESVGPAVTLPPTDRSTP